MAKFDLEVFSDTLKNYLIDNMAAKVAEINTEKGDDPVLNEIPAAAYFEDFNEKIVNFTDFIYFGFDEFEPGVSNAGEIGQPVSMFFLTLVIDQDGGVVGRNKILRYTRAMFEIFEENATTDANISDLEMIILPPDRVTLDLSSDWYKTGGVRIKGTIVL